MVGTALSPREAQLEHQQAILASLPRPKAQRVQSNKMRLHDDLNPAVGASPARVKLYRDRWVDALSHALVVCRLGNAYVIVDGRHRWLARRGNPFTFDCLVFEDLSDEQMAALFLYYNQERRNPSPTEKHLAASAAGDPVALIIDRVTQVRGVTSDLRAVATCEAVIRDAASLDDGEGTLNWTLRILTEAWPASEPNRLDSVFIRGLGRFFRKHGGNPKLHEERVIRALNQQGKQVPSFLKGIIVAEGGSSGMGSAGAVVRYLEDQHARFSGGNRL